ncbi:hypothetical protein H2200_003865 [Cladophialophora chaetospira]|uniref:Zn(2)-C6 fungal-type domain-containing protein n=1 Tax=Cladophialophora chaetospira TaxID=386627 RepID=A0AA38XF07_9EURO|nr:hypothetical protein H2200_003865 [Cladophialophora chaetospira]
MTEGGNNFGKFAEGSVSAQNQSSLTGDQLDMPGLIRSSSSSPNVHDMAAEGPPLSPADKKRNKLGYHRTAVACGHCRRRKIRCIPAFEDPSGRCQNCIRLKKDCHFFPVDQQNAVPGKRMRSTTKTSEGVFNEGDASVASSSPGGIGILRSASMEKMNHADVPLDTPPLSKESPGFHGFHPSRSMSVQGLEFVPSYDGNQQHNQRQQILAQSSYSSQSYATDPMNPQIYQQPYGHSLPTQYSSTFTTGSLPTTMASLAQEHPYEYQTHQPNGAYHWGQQTRSISSDASEELSSGFPTPFRTNTYPSFERRMTGHMQHLPPTSSSMGPMGIENQHSATHSEFEEPVAYQSMHMGMRHWGGGAAGSLPQASAPGGASYSQGWYQPHSSMTELGQEEGQPHQILPSQSHNTRGQLNPG